VVCPGGDEERRGQSDELGHGRHRGRGDDLTSERLPAPGQLRRLSPKPAVGALRGDGVGDGRRSQGDPSPTPGDDGGLTSITEKLFAPLFATQTTWLVASTVTPRGSAPTGMVVVTVLVAITDTLLELKFAT
jgi:hypothetical protein